MEIHQGGALSRPTSVSCRLFEPLARLAGPVESCSGRAVFVEVERFVSLWAASRALSVVVRPGYGSQVRVTRLGTADQGQEGWLYGCLSSETLANKPSALCRVPPDGSRTIVSRLPVYSCNGGHSEDSEVTLYS